MLSGCISDVAGAGAGSHKTPATHLRGILKKPLSAGAAGAGGAGQRATPGSCVKFHLGAAGSAGKPGPGRSAKQASADPGGGRGSARATNLQVAKHMPCSCCKQSAVRPAQPRHIPRLLQGASTGKRRQCGQKRKALLELLEQVESLVQVGGWVGLVRA